MKTTIMKNGDRVDGIYPDAEIDGKDYWRIDKTYKTVAGAKRGVNGMHEGAGKATHAVFYENHDGSWMAYYTFD